MKREQKDIFILVKLSSGDYSLHSAKAGHEEWLGSGETLEKIEELVAKWCKRTGGSIDRLKEKVFSFKPQGHTYPKWNNTVREMWEDRYSDMFEDELNNMIDAGLKNSLFRPKLVSKKRKSSVKKSKLLISNHVDGKTKEKVTPVHKDVKKKVVLQKKETERKGSTLVHSKVHKVKLIGR